MNIQLRRFASGALLAAVVACGGGDSTGPGGVPTTITAVSPSRGTVGTELTVTGTGFRDGVSVRVGSFVATDVQVASPTTLYAKARPA